MSKKTHIRSNFVSQLERLREWAAFTGGNLLRAPHYYPYLRNWDGNLNDMTDTGETFSRIEHANDFVTIVSDVRNPATTGDLIAMQIQGDFLASLERAYRDRHKTSVRAALHTQAKRVSHGHVNGIFRGSLQNYVENILKSAGGPR